MCPLITQLLMEGEWYGIALSGRKVLAKDVRMPTDKHHLNN